MKDKNNSFLYKIDSELDYKQKSPQGIYDSFLLCTKCEQNIFQKFDDYGTKVFLDQIGTRTLSNSGKLLTISDIEIEIEKIVLFLLSILWRSSVSKRGEFSQIDLGPYEEEIKEKIAIGRVDINKYNITVLRYTDQFGSRIIKSPTRNRINGINFNEIHLGNGYRIYIKTDKRTFSDGDILKAISMQSNHKNTFHVLHGMDLQKQDEFKWMLSEVKRVNQ